MALKNQPWSRQSSDYEAAAIEVLKSAKRPLTIQEITDRIVDRGLVTVRGKTPQKSLYAIIFRRERNRVSRGGKPIFRKTKEGNTVYYSLNT